MGGFGGTTAPVKLAVDGRLPPLELLGHSAGGQPPTDQRDDQHGPAQDPELVLLQVGEDDLELVHYRFVSPSTLGLFLASLAFAGGLGLPAELDDKIELPEFTAPAADGAMPGIARFLPIGTHPQAAWVHRRAHSAGAAPLRPRHWDRSSRPRRPASG